MIVVSTREISRRALLAGCASTLACGHRKAVGLSGLCFVANQAGRSVTVVDLGRFRVRRQIPLDAAPSEVISHSSHKVFVLAPEAGTVYEIDAVKLAVTRRARAGSSAVGMQLAPANDALWILYRDPAALVELPLDSFRPGRRIRLAAPPDAFELSSRGIAAVATARNRTVELASLADANIGRTLLCPDEPSLVIFRKDGRQLLAGSRGARNLTVFDVDRGAVVVRLPLPIEPRHASTNGDGGQIFISGAGMDAVVVVYPYETEIAETILAGRAPDGMAVTDTPGFLLVTNPDTNSITVLDFENNGKLVAAVQVGQEPRSIVVTPAGPGQDQYALVLNEKSGDMAVIRMYNLVSQDPSRRYRPAPLFALIPVGERPVSAAIVMFT
jgi:DNA-binding beta-propeller fold protein YncE